MRNLIKNLIILGSLLVFAGAAGHALAATPNLNVSSSGDSINLTVSNADPNFPVELDFINPGTNLPATITSTNWNTDFNGVFFTSLSAQANGIMNGASVYVVVNRQQSSRFQYNSNNFNGNFSGSLSFSQNNITLAIDQTVTVTANSNSGSIFVSGNSTPSVASYTVSGNNITIFGNNTGSTTFTVCATGSSACGSLFVIVGSGTSGGTISFSQSSVTINQNQTATLNIFGGSGNYFLSSNSNSFVAMAIISGGNLVINGLNSGSATLTVCQNSSSIACGSVFVTVNSTGTGGNLIFSTTNPALTIGQSQFVSITSPFGASMGFFISNNSNPNAVSASISGSSLFLVGQTMGSSTVTVCQSGNSLCGSVFVVVNGGNFNNNLALSQTSINLAAGQSLTITATNNAGSVFVSGNSNPSVVSSIINGSNISIFGNSIGSATLTVCASGTSQCGSIFVTVNSNPSGSIVAFSNNNPTMTFGQNLVVGIYSTNGYTGNYYISNNSNPNVVTAIINGTSLNLSAQQMSGSSTITICQSGAPLCGFLVVTVGNNVLGASIYSNGQLLNIGGTVFIVYRNTLSGFNNAAAFLGLGFSFANALNVGPTNIPISSHVITTASAAHPWGSWVINGQTVYFVSENGLIPISDWNIFLNNGGQASWIVPANTWDFQLPLLPVMTFNDFRLR